MKSGKYIVKTLRARGWTVVRTTGSHRVMAKDIGQGKRMVVVPVHGNKDLPLGTLKGIEKSTGERLH